MIRHCVLFRFRHDIDDAAITRLLQQLADLQSTVEGMRSVCYGRNVSPEGRDQGFAWGVVMDFIDARRRDDYLVHPAHRAVAERIVDELEGGQAGVIVVDIEV